MSRAILSSLIDRKASRMLYGPMDISRYKLHGDSILDMVPCITSRSAVQTDGFIGFPFVFLAVSGQIWKFRFGYGIWSEIREALGGEVNAGRIQGLKSRRQLARGVVLTGVACVARITTADPEHVRTERLSSLEDDRHVAA